MTNTPQQRILEAEKVIEEARKEIERAERDKIIQRTNAIASLQDSLDCFHSIILDPGPGAELGYCQQQAMLLSGMCQWDIWLNHNDRIYLYRKGEEEERTIEEWNNQIEHQRVND